MSKLKATIVMVGVVACLGLYIYGCAQIFKMIPGAVDNYVQFIMENMERAGR